MNFNPLYNFNPIFNPFDPYNIMSYKELYKSDFIFIGI